MGDRAVVNGSAAPTAEHAAAKDPFERGRFWTGFEADWTAHDATGWVRGLLMWSRRFWSQRWPHSRASRRRAQAVAAPTSVEAACRLGLSGVFLDVEIAAPAEPPPVAPRPTFGRGAPHAGPLHPRAPLSTMLNPLPDTVRRRMAAKGPSRTIKGASRKGAFAWLGACETRPPGPSAAIGARARGAALAAGGCARALCQPCRKITAPSFGGAHGSPIDTVYS